MVRSGVWCRCVERRDNIDILKCVLDDIRKGIQSVSGKGDEDGAGFRGGGILNCPRCGREMEVGTATLVASDPADLLWSREKIPRFWKIRRHGEIIQLIARGFWPHKGQSCSVCKDCGIAVLEYPKQPSQYNNAPVESPSEFELKNGRQKW